MTDWIRYDENFDAGGDGGCLWVRDNEDGSYNMAGVIWLDVLGDEKPYYAFEAQVMNGECFDDITVTDAWSAGDAFSYLTDPYVVSVIGEFNTLEEGAAAVNSFYGTTRMS